ncbi:hypothetical protein ACWEQO_18315 [Streptomyces sp. NPDC004051]
MIRAERNDRSRYVVEQTLALLHRFKRLAVRWERRTELHDVFVSLRAVPQSPVRCPA